MKILLIDDSSTMRRVQKNIINQLNLEDLKILEASDGYEGLKCLKTTEVDLILLDWNMPNMDGVTFTKKFRETNLDTPILMVTTEGEKNSIFEAVEAGVDNYLPKPFTPEMLLEKLKQVMDI